MREEDKYVQVGLLYPDLDLEEEGALSKPPSKKRNWTSILFVLITLFVAESSRGLVLSTIFMYLKQYGGDGNFLGIVIGSFSVGRLIGGFALGWYYEKRGTKEVLLIALGLSILGNLLYGIGIDKWVILFSRTLVGFSTGVLSVVRASIAKNTADEERAKFMAYTGSVQFIGFALVPGISWPLSHLEWNINGYEINQLNSPGFLLAIGNGLLFFALLFFGKESIEGKAIDHKEEFDNEPKNMKYYVGIILFVFLNFVARGVLALLETVGTPIYMEVRNLKEGDALDAVSQMFLILGAGGFVIFFLLEYMRKLASERKLLIIGFLLIGAGSFTLIKVGHSYTLAQFLAGATLIWSLGSPIAQTLIISTFSKILGTRPQGVMMGLIGAAGSVGRIIVPMLSGPLGNNPSFIICGVFSSLAAIFVALTR